MAVRDTRGGHAARLLVDRPRGLRLLEPRDAARRAGRRRAVGPARVRARRGGAGGLPRAARAAVARARTAGGRRAGRGRGADLACRSSRPACRCWWPRWSRSSPRWRRGAERAASARSAPTHPGSRDVVDADPARRRRAATRSSSPGSRSRSAVLDGVRVQRVAILLPVALLAALIATQTFADGIDARAAGLAAAVVALLAARAVPRRRRGRPRSRPLCYDSSCDPACGRAPEPERVRRARAARGARPRRRGRRLGRLLHLGSPRLPRPADARGRPAGRARRDRGLDVEDQDRRAAHAARPAAAEQGRARDRDARPPLRRPADLRRGARLVGRGGVRGPRRAGRRAHPRGQARRGAAGHHRAVDRRARRPRGRALHGPRHAVHPAPAAAHPGVDRRRLARAAPVPPRRALGRRVPAASRARPTPRRWRPRHWPRSSPTRARTARTPRRST